MAECRVCHNPSLSESLAPARSITSALLRRWVMAKLLWYLCLTCEILSRILCTVLSPGNYNLNERERFRPLPGVLGVPEVPGVPGRLGVDGK